MTHEIVDNHTNQTTKTGKVLVRVEEQLDSESKNQGHNAAETASDTQKTTLLKCK